MEKSIAKEIDYNDKNLSILDVHNKGYIKRPSEPKKHYTQNKWAVDVDVLIDDSPSKLNKFQKKSVNNGSPICLVVYVIFSFKYLKV